MTERFAVDLAGPKLRTGPVEPGAAVIKCRPKRDVYGRVVTPSRIWLTPEDNPDFPPSCAAACLRLPADFLEILRPGDRIRLRDARKARRILRISRVRGRSRWAEARQTIYFVPGLELSKISHRESSNAIEPENAATRIGQLPHFAPSAGFGRSPVPPSSAFSLRASVNRTHTQCHPGRMLRFGEAVTVIT